MKKQSTDERKIRPERFTWEEGDFMIIRYDEEARKEVEMALQEQQDQNQGTPTTLR